MASSPISRLLSSPRSRCVAFLLALLSTAAAVEPVEFSWTDPVDGNWSEATKWTNDQASGTAPLAGGSAEYVLRFESLGTYAATQDLGAGFLLNQLRFGESSVTLAGEGLQFGANGAAALPELQQLGASEISISAPIALAADLSFGGSGTGTVTLSGGVSGGGGLIKGGSGLLSVTGGVAYSGNTTVNAGTLKLSQPNPANDDSTIAIAAGAALELDFFGNDTVTSLVLDGVAQANGTYDVANSGGAITGTGAIVVYTPPPPVPSSDATLASLTVGSASLSPAFNPLTGSYSAAVGNTVVSLNVTPTVAVTGATVKVNGISVVSGSPSNPIPLNVGTNLITAVVTAEDGIATRTYTVGVKRAGAATVATVPAVVIDSSRATLKGDVNPNGVATVYFEYGPTIAYGSRTPDLDVSISRPFVASLSGLSGATTYHFRAVVDSPGGPSFGNDLSFITPPNPPVAATGAPADVTTSSASLIGAVNPNGVQAVAYFEYGLTTAYGQSTPVKSIPAGTGIVSVKAANVTLISGASYHYRLVASNAAGTSFGEDVIFTVQTGSGGGSGVPSDPPTVATDPAELVGFESAILRGNVNPNGGTTLARFEYGLTTAYGKSSATQGVGSGGTTAQVALPVQGLLPGRTYHYRFSASNNLGTSHGEDATFNTDFPPPTAVTGASTVLTTTSVRLEGTARARGAPAKVWIDYGTDEDFFSNSVEATPTDIDGDLNTEVSAEVSGLKQGVTYYYRVRASRDLDDEAGEDGIALEVGVDVGVGEVHSFDVASLSGLIQQFPPGVPAAERAGSVVVTLSPPDIGSGWRFAGEQFWRTSGVPATGFTSGDRVIEYRPVPGFIQPANETVAVISGPVASTLSRTYAPSGGTSSGSLTVFLKPQDLTEGIAPARWRFFGEGDDDWKESGTEVTGLVPGNHVILCKPVDGRTTPPPVTATVADAQPITITITYYLKEEPVGEAPVLQAFQAVSTDQSLPNAYVGQIRSDAGSGSGFVVRPRVVATAGHVIFDDGTLSATTGVQWLFQRDREVHDPVPQIPRGFYLLSGYAAQRAEDNSPGVSTPASQNLDAGTLFFLDSAGRGGFSGYLASDSASNEFLLSSSLKTLVGYPIGEIPEADLDRMHATPPADVTFTKSFERTYISSGIRASGGASGGPLCVLSENGAYYPAAIYLGGTGQTVVRALDSDVLSLIGFADASAGAGVGAAGGSLSPPETSEYPDETHGALKVIIEPAAARAAGAGWRINSEAPYQVSGDQLDSLDPTTYSLSFPALEGWVPPAPQTVNIQAGLLTTVTFTYEDFFLPPAITSADAAAGIRGQPFSYQITGDHSPVLFSLRGLLPAGLSLNALTGLIEGTPTEAGVFPVTIGASNSGGADSRELLITLTPVLEDQAVTVPYLVAMSYLIAIDDLDRSGARWTPTGLSQGLSLDAATGVISGTPTVPGKYEVPVTVTVRGASAQATVTMVITGIPPQITLQPVASRSIQYGTKTALTVAATGLPEPTFQWYEGESGNIDLPVPGATSSLFTTPVLTSQTRFWARASSISGTADSQVSVISILPSANASLSALVTSEGPVTPFNPAVFGYTLAVPNEVTAILLTPVAEVTQSVVKVQGIVVPTDAASAPVNLVVGANQINVDVASGDGSTSRRYILAVTRGLPASVVTGLASQVKHITATLNGTAIPNGKGTAFFQYGTTTAYGNATPGVEISGTSSQPVTAPVAGLSPETTYHYRIGITTGAGTIFGLDRTLLTTKAPPYVATGQASDVEDGKVKLIGAVATNGSATTVHFEWGETTEYGTNTSPQLVPGGSTVVDIEHVLENLVPGTLYHYRLVGVSAAGNSFGEDVAFIASAANGGAGIPVAPPEASTGDALDPSTSSVVLLGSANPMGGTTFVRFEYGTSDSYGNSTPAQGIGSGSTPALVVVNLGGLSAGRTYHYRLVAVNSLDVSYGEDRTFSTRFLPPLAITGAASPLNSTSVRLTGTVAPRGATAEVYFDYWADGVSLARVAASSPTVEGIVEKPVQVDLADLQPGKTYSYRVVAKRVGVGEADVLGDPKTVQSDGLVGLLQHFPRKLDSGEYTGEVQVDLIPAAAGGKWRFVGEIHWRPSGTKATGMTTGDREIEFLPVPGYHQPGRELVGVVSEESSEEPKPPMTREYFVAPTMVTAGLQVLLEPQNRTGPSVPLSSRVQWRLAGEDSTQWKESGTALTGLTPGSYLVEFKAALDLDGPPPCTVELAAGENKLATFNYNPDQDAPAGSLRVLPYDQTSTRTNQPYAYVGQVRNEIGSHSGFVVKPRVVATTAQSLFDEFNLSQIPGVQWLFQHDKEVHAPKPQIPRGFYVFSGYAALRKAEDTPGRLSIAAQDLNVAAMYFLEDAGRGGYSGFLASSEADLPLTHPTALKTLVGYPVRGGGSSANQGRMEATRVDSDPYVPVFPLPETGSLPLIYDNEDIKGLSGMDGGPLCIQVGGGNYFPAGIYLGGGNPVSLVRAIDAGVIDLFSRAELTANTGNNNNTGGIFQTTYSAISATVGKGALTVIIEPAEARAVGPLWSLGGDSTFLSSGTRKNNMTPGSYALQFKAIPGFQAPVQQSTGVLANSLTTVTFTYLPELSALSSWRLEKFGSTTNGGSGADAQDPDADGSLNIDEYIAGTDPLNASDVFKVTTAGLANGTFTVNVPGKAGRLYTLQRCTSLALGDWGDVASSGTLVADNPALTLSDAAAAGDDGFYRVVVELPSP